MSINPKRRLIKNLFKRENSISDLKELLEILQTDESNEAPEIMTELFQQIGEIPELPQTTSDTIFEEVIGTIHELETEQMIQKSSSVIRAKKIRIWMGRAAAVLLLVLSAVWIYELSQSDNLIYKESALGEIKEFLLPDGSLVSINGNSKLSHAPDWHAGESRVVYLEGEAYFEVRKKPSTHAKFKVVTRDLTIEVLGTSFNVNTRKSETRVFLEEGEIQIYLDHQIEDPVHLNPGEIIRYSTKQKMLVSPEQVAPELQISWKEGILQFKETSLIEILESLSATNNAKFEIVGEKLAERKFTMAFPTEDLDTTISIIGKTTGTTFSKNGNSYTVSLKSHRTNE